MSLAGNRILILLVASLMVHLLPGSGSAPALGGEIEAGAAAEFTRVNNGAVPRDGHLTVTPRELWRRGGDEDEIFFGFIITGLTDASGNIYLLDRQLATVFVFSPEAGGMFVLTQAQCRSRHLVCCGTRVVPHEDGFAQDRFLVVCDESGVETARILELRDPNAGGSTVVESGNYWVNEGRWCVGPDGCVYTAPLRDAYEVHVHAPDGRLRRVVARDFQSWRRTSREKDRLREVWAGDPDENGRLRDVRIADVDPCIDELHVGADGALWVRHSRSDREQAPGVMLTYDVFDPSGEFVRTVAITVPGNPARDELLHLSADRLLLIEGFHDASRAMWGDSPDEPDDEVRPLEVVCYAVEYSGRPTGE